MAHKIHSEPERTFGCFEQLSICNFKPPVPVEHLVLFGLYSSLILTFTLTLRKYS